jgi:hypothetical protein
MGGPLDRARIIFTVTSGDAYFPGRSRRVTTTTDADGVALAPALRAGNIAGPVAVTATSPGVPGQASFELTVSAG